MYWVYYKDKRYQAIVYYKGPDYYRAYIAGIGDVSLSRHQVWGAVEPYDPWRHHAN